MFDLKVHKVLKRVESCWSIRSRFKKSSTALNVAIMVCKVLSPYIGGHKTTMVKEGRYEKERIMKCFIWSLIEAKKVRFFFRTKFHTGTPCRLNPTVMERYARFGHASKRPPRRQGAPNPPTFWGVGDLVRGAKPCFVRDWPPPSKNGIDIPLSTPFLGGVPILGHFLTKIGDLYDQFALLKKGIKLITEKTSFFGFFGKNSPLRPIGRGFSK